MVVSGQDYPLRPIPQLERHLAESPHHALLYDCWALDLRAEPPLERGEFYRRYRYRHYCVPGASRTPRAGCSGRSPTCG